MVDRVTFETAETGSTPPKPEAATDPNRPKWLPENFKDPEALASNWSEQRAEITRLQQALAKNKGEQAPADEQKPSEQAPAEQKPAEGEQKPEEKKPDEKPPESTDDAAKKIVEQSGADFSAYQQEFDTTGDVTPENRTKIAEALKAQLGENAEAIVNDFIEGRKAVVENDRRMFMEAAGGEDNYATMIAWAKDNMPKDQIDAYNAQVNSRDRSATLFAIEGLKAKFEKAEGKAPALLKGGQQPAPNGSAFKSSAEMTRAMQDPRYKTDPAYRDEVKARLAASKF